MVRAFVVTCLVVMALAVSAMAGMNQHAKVAVHVVPHTTRSCSKSFPSIRYCSDIITTEASADVDAFPVFFDLIEYQGFEYGLTWPGMYSCSFRSCSDLTIGNIVNPGDGISHAWLSCQYHHVAITGFGWIFDYGTICVIPHPVAGGPNIGDCHDGGDGVMDNSCAGIGGYYGGYPCG